MVNEEHNEAQFHYSPVIVPSIGINSVAYAMTFRVAGSRMALRKPAAIISPPHLQPMWIADRPNHVVHRAVHIRTAVGTALNKQMLESEHITPHGQGVFVRMVHAESISQAVIEKSSEESGVHMISQEHKQLRRKFKSIWKLAMDLIHGFNKLQEQRGSATRIGCDAHIVGSVPLCAKITLF
jgi:hypothetical protein